jgi:chromosomal replication initiator protein
MKAILAPCDLSFIVSEKRGTVAPDSFDSTPLFEHKPSEELIMEKAVRARIRPGFTFENFAVSGSNQMAWAAAEAVARQPGVSYNPLFLYGGVGVGKTHLMHAVGYKLLSQDLEMKILACSSEEFGNDIIEGIRNKTTANFREKYRKLNALFVDDIQFIAGKDTIQEEFFHTFNAVTSAGGQVILTSDRPPSEIPKLEARLVSRFEAGMIVDISEPDFELRCAIIQIKTREKGLALGDEEVGMIAGNIDSARKIEGFLVRLGSELKIKQTVISEELIQRLLGRGAAALENHGPKKSPGEVIDAICTHYTVGKRSLLGERRTRSIARPRQILMYILRTELQLSLEEIGRVVGGRDHSTVIHGVDRITKLSSSDVDIREDLLRIKNLLWG